MSERPHYWRGEWLDDARLEARLDELPSWAARVAPPATEAVLSACEALGRALLEKGGALRARLERALLEAGAARAEELGPAFAELAGLLSRASLEAKLKRELGGKRPFSLRRISGDEDVFEAWQPLGLLVHVSPQNSFATGAMSVVEGLLAGNVNFLKTGGSEPPFAQLFLEALAQADASGTLKESLIAARISSRRSDLLAKVFAVADAIAAWGGEDALEAIRKLAPKHVPVVEWGHRISFIYLTPGAAADPATLEQIARECCEQEQQACSSPQCVYVDAEDWDALNRLADSLAAALSKVSPAIPRQAPDDAAAAEITMVSQCHELEGAAGRARLIAAEDGAWRILVDARGALTPSPLYRSVWLKPLPRRKLVETLRPMRRYLQTVGLACALGDAAELTALLLAAGATRLRRPGEMSRSYAGEPHDGRYALQRYARRVSVQLPAGARGISGLDELAAFPPLAWKAPPPVTPKEAFHADAAGAQLFFKSGGTSGAPKLSTFTYEQYDDDMHLGAEGLYAAGLDPKKDRAMNLFFSGGLYGGFLSIFSALERLRVVQYPMAAHADLELVGRAVVDQRVNVLLGMPSYLMSLFEKNAALFKSYGGVEKIFYGGEHFTAAQLRRLKEDFGVRLIRSGAYGSVDIGPMGFQCEHCEDGVHHLQQRLHSLEILKLDADVPVAGEEAGRLVFSPREPGSSKPLRYAIGDVGRWIADGPAGCPCGRRSPRFKLLGRTGDVVRIGSMFLNYQKFAHILSSQGGYAGHVQLVLAEDGLREKVVLRLSKGAGLSAAEGKRLCLEHYGDLAEAVVADKVLVFEAEELAADAFARSPASGKLLRVVDSRKRS